MRSVLRAFGVIGHGVAVRVAKNIVQDNFCKEQMFLFGYGVRLGEINLSRLSRASCFALEIPWRHSFTNFLLPSIRHERAFLFKYVGAFVIVRPCSESFVITRSFCRHVGDGIAMSRCCLTIVFAFVIEL